MNTTKPTLKFQLDIVDYQDDDAIIESVRNLLKLSKDREFVDNIFWKNREKVSVYVSPTIPFIISQCDCY